MPSSKRTIYLTRQQFTELLNLKEDEQIMEMELQFDEGEWVLIADIYEKDEDAIELPF